MASSAILHHDLSTACRNLLFVLFSLLVHQQQQQSPSFASAYSSPGFVYRCPVTPFGFGGYASPYGGGINYCGTGSLFHYYICCDYNPTECCLQLEPWVIIFLVIIGVLALLSCIGCCVFCVMTQRK